MTFIFFRGVGIPPTRSSTDIQDVKKEGLLSPCGRTVAPGSWSRRLCVATYEGGASCGVSPGGSFNEASGTGLGKCLILGILNTFSRICWRANIPSVYDVKNEDIYLKPCLRICQWFIQFLPEWANQKSFGIGILPRFQPSYNGVPWCCGEV